VRKLLLFLLLIGFIFAQEPVFQYTAGFTKNHDNWADTLDAFIWHSVGNDTTITGPLFGPKSGYDGLRQFYVRIDSFGVALHGDAISIRNFSKPIQSGSGYKTKSVTIDTTAAFNILFIYQTWLGQTFGWQTNDTLEWSLYSDTTRVTTTTTLTLSEEATLYTSLFRPSETDGERAYGIWQTDVPRPWRVVGYFPHVIAGDTNTVQLKFEVVEHVPNK
jgi:hypothetical protein